MMNSPQTKPRTNGHLLEWSQTEDDAVEEIGEMYGLEQKDYESVDEYRERIMQVAITSTDEEMLEELGTLEEDDETEEMISKELERETNWLEEQQKPDSTQETWNTQYGTTYYPKSHTPPTSTPITIIGIDPGIANVGWSVLKYDIKTWTYSYLDSGMINTNKFDTDGAKYTYIADTLYELILEKAPLKQMAIEELFYSKNVKSANRIAGTIAVLQMIAHHTGLDPIMINPQEVKKAATGTAKADKKKIMESINKTMNLEIKTSHEADAIAIAIAAILKENKEESKPEQTRSPKNDPATTTNTTSHIPNDKSKTDTNLFQVREQNRAKQAEGEAKRQAANKTFLENKQATSKKD